MNLIIKYEKYIPYLYFISISIYWFTIANRSEGISAYPILLLGIPFLWQLLKPSRKLNFYLGISFMCISVYLLIGYYINAINLINWNTTVENILFFSIALIFGNFLMSLWIIKNSLKRKF